METDMAPDVKALVFDVFGTVVDWRASLIRQLSALGPALRLALDWTRFADAWRGLYQPSMEEVRSGGRSFVVLDELHRESLASLLDKFGARKLSDGELDRLNAVWHRLDAWPDSVE